MFEEAHTFSDFLERQSRYFRITNPVRLFEGDDTLLQIGWHSGSTVLPTEETEFSVEEDSAANHPFRPLLFDAIKRGNVLLIQVLLNAPLTTGLEIQSTDAFSVRALESLFRTLECDIRRFQMEVIAEIRETTEIMRETNEMRRETNKEIRQELEASRKDLAMIAAGIKEVRDKLSQNETGRENGIEHLAQPDSPLRQHGRHRDDDFSPDAEPDHGAEMGCG